jgi:hypothetical protein
MEVEVKGEGLEKEGTKGLFFVLETFLSRATCRCIFEL